VSPITPIDDEATQPPPVAPTCTVSSLFHENSSVTLSANSLVTKPGSETLARNKDQMHSKCSRYSCKEYVANEVRFCSTTFYKKLPEL
ncbi:hypothetical protein K469DRAFT_705122, partial [Zopfia rhizophila CBS 207.26]